MPKRIASWLRRRRIEAELVPPALTIMFATFASRVLGTVREMLFASRFGAPPELDAYLAAFQLPDLITKLFVLGAFFSAFVPVFARLKDEGKEKEAWEVADAITTLLMIILVAASLLMIIFAPLFVKMIVPGFDSQRFGFTVQLLRIMAFSPLLLGISTILTAVLNSYHKFTASAYAPVMYNVGIIMGVLYFIPAFGMIWGLGMGVIFGALLHIFTQLIPALRIGYRWRRSLNLKLAGVRQVIKLGIPRMVGMGASQVDMFIDVVLGSFLPIGSITLINYANRLQLLPVGIFGLSIAQASFPFFVEKAAHHDMKGFSRVLFRNLKHIFYFALPASAGLIILRVEVVRLLYGQAGTLDWYATNSVAFALALYSISIFAQCAIYILSRAFYALQDTKTPLYAGLVGIGINAMLSIVLVFTVHHFSMLALSYTTATIVNMTVLFLLLYNKLGKLEMNSFLKQIFYILFATGCMAFVVWLMQMWLSSILDITRVRYLLLMTVACVGAGGMVYLALTSMLRCVDIAWFKRIIHRGEMNE
ncbi:MAG TPA: murein biosynthesis integral membrane protein MurJ [bacterium]|nr:murein biosynthesis integral membrane protein MurJ [bacterium]